MVKSAFISAFTNSRIWISNWKRRWFMAFIDNLSCRHLDCVRRSPLQSRCYPRSWCAKCRLGRSSQLSKVAARLSASLKSCGLEALSREAAGISLIGRGRSRDHRKVSPLVPLLRHGEWKADIHQLAETGRLPVAGRWGKAAAGGSAGGHWPC